MKVPPVSADALSTDVGPTTKPRVVVVVPTSDPPPASAPDSISPPSVEARGSVDGVVPSLPPVSSGSVDPVDALESLEKATIPPAAAEDDDAPAAAEETREGQGDETETVATRGSGSTSKMEEPAYADTKRSFASTMAFGSAHEPRASDADAPQKVETTVAEAQPTQPVKVVEAPLPAPKVLAGKAVEVPEDVARAGDAEDVARAEDAEDVARAEDAETTALRAGEHTPAPARKKDKKKSKGPRSERGERVTAARPDETTDPDEISVPPIGDVGVDEQFFSEGDVARHLAVDAEALEGDALTITDKAKQKAEPHVVERRARFVRYVKWAVAGAAVVCLAAVARTTLTSAKAPSPAVRAASAVATAATETPPAAPKAAVQAAAPVAAPAEPLAVAPPAAPVATAAAQPSTTSAALPAATEKTEQPSATESPAEANAEEVSGDAKEEKAKARTFLEKRKISDAIDAGERSVKLDPTDGEAWLILGAAYQEKGNMVEARRAYASCVKDGKTGPRAECAKMLR